ncbi:PIG-L deacetylase family protein [Endothiovibrio diazotrophicus]
MIEERHLLPYATSELPPGPWLLFAPHADDETFGLGGTLALAARAGIEVAVVILTDGALGGSGDREALCARRKAEARAALAALGGGELLFWDQPDRGLVPSEALQERVVALIGERQPAQVFFPSPMEPHVDHRAASRLVWEALRRERRVRPLAAAYEITVQGPINRLIDISAVMAEKRAAIECYVSQLAENNYYGVSHALDVARTFTLPPGVVAAEGFHQFAREDLVRDYATQVRRLLAPYWTDAPEGEEAPARRGWFARLCRTRR